MDEPTKNEESAVGVPKKDSDGSVAKKEAKKERRRISPWLRTGKIFKILHSIGKLFKKSIVYATATYSLKNSEEKMCYVPANSQVQQLSLLHTYIFLKDQNSIEFHEVSSYCDDNGAAMSWLKKFFRKSTLLCNKKIYLRQSGCHIHIYF